MFRNDHGGKEIPGLVDENSHVELVGFFEIPKEASLRRLWDASGDALGDVPGINAHSAHEQLHNGTRCLEGK